MKILICICTYKRNFELIKCLKKFQSIFIPGNIEIEFLIVDNTTNYESKIVVKNFKKKFKFSVFHYNEKKRGIVYARNKCLKEVKKINCEYVIFFDDDCIVDKKWFINFQRLTQENEIEVITGPQIHNNQNEDFFEKKYNKDLISVKWAATNNVVIKKKILIDENIFFDTALNKFGMGEDQLFFSRLKKRGYQILWSKKLRVVEKSHKHRLNIQWIKERSFRLGVIGYYIDKKLYGTFLGLFINYIKCLIYFLMSLFLIKINKSINFINRSYGRLLGPFVFKKIDFYKK
tara:strand:+ start:1388 stop:2254 length:867 start_codon:yes stop_codon:yes gene_type:complete